MTKLPSSHLNIKLMAFDLDDTLLNHELDITPKTREAIFRAAEKGIYIVLCSGRSENAILPYVRKLEIAGMESGRYLIALNGSTIFDLHQRLNLFTANVPGSILQECYTTCCKEGLSCQVYSPDSIFASNDNEWTRVDAKLTSLNMVIPEHFYDFLGNGHSKMVIPGDPEKIARFQPELKARLGDRAVVFTSKPFFLEVMPANCGKGEAIEFLANKLGIPMEQTMGFGDSMNDESMIIRTVHSVAMCNGIDHIKNTAKYVTRFSNEEDGIADFLNEFVL